MQSIGSTQSVTKHPGMSESDAHVSTKQGPVFLRYWGSHFKFSRQVDAFAAEFKPLIGRGWRCILVLEREPEDPHWARLLTDLGVRIEYMPRPRSNFDWRIIGGIFKLCRRVKPSILVCTNMHTNTLIGAALARVPVRIWCKEAMNSAFEECLPSNWRTRLVPSVRLSSLLATRVVAVSAGVRNELLNLGISARRVVVRHVPRRLGRRVSADEAGKVRQQLGLSPGHIVISSVGHTVPVKGWDVLLPAFRQVADAVPEARLVLVGSYSASHEKCCYESLRAYICSAGLGEKIIFTGQRNDVPAVLAASDIFVLPSRSEGCSYALIEALEANLPCVVTRVGAAEQVVSDGVNGYIVERSDEHALAKALLRLASDSDLLARFRSHASVPACIPTLEQYAVQMAEDYETLYLEARS
jgi:glycosyltransferase involved in cell wall biosynthesis